MHGRERGYESDLMYLIISRGNWYSMMIILLVAYVGIHDSHASQTRQIILLAKIVLVNQKAKMFFGIIKSSITLILQKQHEIFFFYVTYSYCSSKCAIVIVVAFDFFDYFFYQICTFIYSFFSVLLYLKENLSLSPLWARKIVNYRNIGKMTILYHENQFRFLTIWFTSYLWNIKREN